MNPKVPVASEAQAEDYSIKCMCEHPLGWHWHRKDGMQECAFITDEERTESGYVRKIYCECNKFIPAHRIPSPASEGEKCGKAIYNQDDGEKSYCQLAKNHTESCTPWAESGDADARRDDNLADLLKTGEGEQHAVKFEVTAVIDHDDYIEQVSLDIAGVQYVVSVQQMASPLPAPAPQGEDERFWKWVKKSHGEWLSPYGNVICKYENVVDLAREAWDTALKLEATHVK